MKILGVDPGTALTGIGIVEGDRKKGFKCLEYFCITTKAETPSHERLHQIFTQMNSVIEKFKPDLVSVEELFFNKNPKTAMAVGRAGGVILLSAAVNNIKVIEFTPLEVKMAITGYGRAEKDQIQKMVKLLLNLKEIPKPDDAADALAIALSAGVTL